MINNIYVLLILVILLIFILLLLILGVVRPAHDCQARPQNPIMLY